MNDEKSFEVEFRAIPSRFSEVYRSYEYEIQYRVKPVQLNWFKRIFMNKWVYLQKCVWVNCYPYKTWNPQETLDVLKKQLKTVKDIEEFEHEEYTKSMRKKMSLEEEQMKGNKIYY